MRVYIGKRKAIEKASIVLENTHIVMNRMLLEIGVLKVFLVRSQTKMRNVLLENERKMIFVIKHRGLD